MGFLSLLIFDPTCSCKNRLNWQLCQDFTTFNCCSN